jgi:formylglycine-generating enzyme required for sulfatase activity
MEFQDVLKDDGQCPMIVVVPSGSFLIGSQPDEPEQSNMLMRRDSERPSTSYEIASSTIDKYEVTFEEAAVLSRRPNAKKPKDEDRG